MTSSGLLRKLNDKGKRIGIIGEATYDLNKMMKHMNRSITMSRKGTESLLAKYGVTIIRDNVVYRDGAFVLEGNGEKLLANDFVLATGSRPKIPGFLRIDGLWSSNDVFLMEKVPSSILIIGGGVIGVEMATLFSDLGAKVTVVELMNRIIPTEDIESSSVLENSLKKKGVGVKTGVKVERVEKAEAGFNTFLSTGEEINTEKVLVAIGREPVIPEGLETTGLVVRGKVATDEETFATSMENVYAIGDVRGQIMLAHVASAEGLTVAEELSGESYEFCRDAIPSVIFSEPEIASTGVRETETPLGEEFEKFVFPMSANGRANTLAERDGFAKLIARKDNHEIVGLTVVGPLVTDILMEGVLAIKNKLTVHELTEAIHPHPTVSEIVKDTAEGLEGYPIHI